MFSLISEKTFFLLTVLVVCSVAPPLSAEIAGRPGATPVTLLYSGNVLGEFEPCG